MSDTFDDLLKDFEDAAGSLANAEEWGSGIAIAKHELDTARIALRDYIERANAYINDWSDAAKRLDAENKRLREVLEEIAQRAEDAEGYDRLLPILAKVARDALKEKP